MSTLRLFFTGLALAVIGSISAEAQVLDPTFPPFAMYSPGIVYSVTEQPDGKLLAVGDLTRINGTNAARLVRLNADGTLDAAFNQRVGADVVAYRARRLDNGQYMLIGLPDEPLKAGGITRLGGLLRLNADGTTDASFDAGSGPSNGSTGIDDVLPLPNGQMLVVGYFERFNGVPAQSIVRLNVDGSVDTSFRQGTGAGGAGEEINTVVPVSDGKFLIGGYFNKYNEQACNGLARLNADGSFDTTFRTDFLAPGSDVYHINVYPNGQFILSGKLNSSSLPNGEAGLVRLQRDGSHDNSFRPPASLNDSGSFWGLSGDAVAIQANGKILVQPPSQPLIRLDENGTLDLSYNPGDDKNSTPHSLTLLRSGKLLLSGLSTNFSGTLDQPLLRLNTDGSTDNAFRPLIQRSATISTLIRQPDGKLLASGSFSEIDGRPVRRLARFTADNKLDEAFSTTFANDIEQTINSLQLQPDGKILFASGPTVHRLLPDGKPDNSLVVESFSTVTKLLLQPDGRILVGGEFRYYAGKSVGGLVRLTASGAYDPTFQVPASGENSLVPNLDAVIMLLQPDGRLVRGGEYRNPPTSGGSVRMVRYTSSGAIDPSFSSAPFAPADGLVTATFTALALQDDNKLLVAGKFSKVGDQVSYNLTRLNPDGTLDASFTPPTINGVVYKLTIQPNNRILVGGQFTAAGLPANLARLLPDGSPDTSFGATAVPNSAVRALLTEPDGKLLIGGGFTSVGGQPIMGLARLVAPNVLHVKAPSAVAEQTTAWPVPARTQLNVAFAPSAHAQQLELLDALGRPVRRQLLAGRQTTSLALEELPVGIYLLRVTYAEGIVTRRVQVQ